MTKLAIFAAGCFWGIEEKYLSQEGVLDTEVGYTGGYTDNPTYHDVCMGDTGHAEAVRVKYDEKIISYEVLVDLFLKCMIRLHLIGKGLILEHNIDLKSFASTTINT